MSCQCHGMDAECLEALSLGIGLLARDGDKHNVDGRQRRKTQQRGLLLEDLTDDVDRNTTLRVLTNLTDIDNSVQFDAQFRDVLKELCKMGLLAIEC